MSTHGIFVAFEGGDGAGKSTQARLLAQAVTRLGRDPVLTREPGGTPLGEQLRQLLLQPGDGAIDARTEALIFAASRSAHVHGLIGPALQRGQVVITDRFIDSSVAYQGEGRKLGTRQVLELNTWATAGLSPHLTVLLDVSPNCGVERRGDTTPDRMESEPTDFHERIRHSFLALAKQSPERYVVIDATLPVAEIHARIIRRLEPLLLPGNTPQVPEP